MKLFIKRDQLQINNITDIREILNNLDNTSRRIVSNYKNHDVILYTAILQGDNQTYDRKLTRSSLTYHKRRASISYDLISSKVSLCKSNKKIRSHKRIQNQSDKNIINTNKNDSESLSTKSFIEWFEDNNTKVKIDIRTSIQTEIKMDNSEFLHKIKEIFTTFQIFISEKNEP